MSSDAVSLLLMKYEQNARDWDQAVSDVRKANALFDRTHGLYKRLRANREGRLGIAALLTDPNPGVRVMAATHSLDWHEAEAVAVLEALERAGGLYAVTAKYTLRGHRSGSLNLDW